MELKIENLLEEVVKRNASDLHLCVGMPPMFRIDGALVPAEGLAPLTGEDLTALVYSVMDDVQKEDLVKDKEVDFSFAFGDLARFRANAFHQKGNLGMALRLIPNKIPTLTELGMPNILQKFADIPRGLVLVTGPTGSGKSTTLAAMVDKINTEKSVHIITIEDPIEYIYEQKKSIIDQREIRVDTEDFPVALKSMFREDVDVVLIGEMRGTETISTAVTAAETGHLVFSTLHTNSASQTISRIIDSFPGEQQGQIRVQLAGSLTGIFSQRLIPRISGGLIPAYELLINNNAVANLIRENRIHEINSVIETSSQEGMVDMNRSLAELVARGEITIESAYMYALDPKVLERMI